MPKKEVPFTLLIRGKVLAYCEDEVSDGVNDNIRHIVEALFGETWDYSHSLEVGNNQTGFTGITKNEFVQQIATVLHDGENIVLQSTLKKMKRMLIRLETKSGFIFKHEGSSIAILELKTEIEKLEHYISTSFEDLDDHSKTFYLARAEKMLKRALSGQNKLYSDSGCTYFETLPVPNGISTGIYIIKDEDHRNNEG